jgi:hypothetical protein
VKVRALSGIGGAVLVAVALGAPTAHAESSFAALSSATAVGISLANDDFPLVPVLEAAGPTAGTSLTSSGQGTAFASDPYPGTTAAELPATAAGLTGLPVPAYPLFVATTSDDEPADYENPGLALHATCSGGGAPGCRASSLAGTAPATSQARSSSVQPSPDEVIATAAADADGLVVPGGVTLSGIHTSATVVLKDGRLTRSSELDVATLTVAGTQAFSIRDGQVLVAGTEAPVPFSTLASALSSAGVEAELFAESQSRYGVVAPALRLRTVLPGGPAVLTKPTTVVFTLGGADASVTLGAFRTDDPPTGSSGTTGGVTAPGGGSVPGSDAGGTVPQVSLPGITGATAPAVPVVEAPLAQAAPVASPAQPFDVSDIYLALVLCGVVWFGATQALRIFGVRFRWT